MAEQKENIQSDQEFWKVEVDAAVKRQKNFHKDGDKAVQRFLDERKETGKQDETSTGDNMFRLNLYHQNITTLLAMLYGRIPETDVKRKWADPDDDIARVSALILKRMLDNPLQEPSSSDSELLRSCLEDRLLPGLGIARIRYEFENEEIDQRVAGVNEETGEQEITTEKMTIVTDESAPLEYVHWRDFLWGYGRVWADIPWIGFWVYFDKEETVKKFGEEVADQVQYDVMPKGSEEASKDETKERPWMKTRFLEIWDKKNRKVCWYSTHLDKLADSKPDPLKVNGFFPCPKPMMANCTTSLVMPRNDLKIAQDLYNQIDILQTRIGIITKAVKVVGIYDSKQDAIKRMMNEGVDNDLIPADNFAGISEAGGLDKLVDWLPIQNITEALSKLQELRDQTIQLLYQITGMADILRGTTEQYTAASSDKLKAKFASIRVQYLQDEFARFASDLMALRAEVIRKHFEPETILDQSNAENMPDDPQIVGAALQAIKAPDNKIMYRIEIKPESIALVDYAQLKAERTEYLTAIGTFLQSAKAMGDAAPAMVGPMAEMLKWGLAGFRGGEEIEGVIDRAIKEMKKEAERPKQPQPNPKVQEIQAKQAAESQKNMEKANNEMNKLMNQHKAKLVEISAEGNADARAEQMQAFFNILETETKFKFDKELKEIDTRNRVEKRQPRS